MQLGWGFSTVQPAHPASAVVPMQDSQCHQCRGRQCCSTSYPTCSNRYCV